MKVTLLILNSQTAKWAKAGTSVHASFSHTVAYVYIYILFWILSSLYQDNLQGVKIIKTTPGAVFANVFVLKGY